jgi:hypothetical protein
MEQMHQEKFSSEITTLIVQSVLGTYVGVAGVFSLRLETEFTTTEREQLPCDISGLRGFVDQSSSMR